MHKGLKECSCILNIQGDAGHTHLCLVREAWGEAAVMYQLSKLLGKFFREKLWSSNWMLCNAMLYSTYFPLCWGSYIPITCLYAFKYPNDLSWTRMWYCFMFKLSIGAWIKRLSKPLLWLNFSGFFFVCLLNNSSYEIFGNLSEILGYGSSKASKNAAAWLVYNKSGSVPKVLQQSASHSNNV